MDGAPVSNVVALVVALGGFLGAVLTPVAVAFINRGSKAAPALAEVVPREQYDALLEQVTNADAMNDMLVRELRHVRSERDDEHQARLAAEARAKDEEQP